MLFAKELNKKCIAAGVNISAASLHPGVIATDLGKDSILTSIFRFFYHFKMKSIEQGAATTIFLCTAPKINGGAYYSDCNELAPTHAQFLNVSIASQLWQESEKRTAVSFNLQ